MNDHFSKFFINIQDYSSKKMKKLWKVMKTFEKMWKLVKNAEYFLFKFFFDLFRTFHNKKKSLNLKFCENWKKNSKSFENLWKDLNNWSFMKDQRHSWSFMINQNSEKWITGLVYPMRDFFFYFQKTFFFLSNFLFLILIRKFQKIKFLKIRFI